MLLFVIPVLRCSCEGLEIDGKFNLHKNTISEMDYNV